VGPLYRSSTIRVIVNRKILHTTWYGTFLLEEGGSGLRVIRFIEAERDPSSIAADIRRTRAGELLDRERSIVGNDRVEAVTDGRLRSLLPDAELLEPGVVGGDLLKDRILPLELLREASELLFRESGGEDVRDANILSAVGALKDIDSSLNLLIERIREWLSRYNDENVTELLDDREFLGKLSETAPEDDDTAAEGRILELPGDDVSGISALSRSALSLWESRDLLEGYLEREMESVAPNLSLVVGPLIGARLIHSAGGLTRLSRLPSSTVQVLGAEKMFFKFLKEGGKPPKHGVLFQHPWVHSLPSAKRGKMARSLAGAASIASRMDEGGGGDAAPLKIKLERRRDAILKMELPRKRPGGRQPPFREGWWADKGGGNRKRGKRRKGRSKRI